MMHSGLAHMTCSPDCTMQLTLSQQLRQTSQQGMRTECNQMSLYLAPAKASSAASSRRWKALAAAGLL